MWKRPSSVTTPSEKSHYTHSQAICELTGRKRRARRGGQTRRGPWSALRSFEKGTAPPPRCFWSPYSKQIRLSVRQIWNPKRLLLVSNISSCKSHDKLLYESHFDCWAELCLNTLENLQYLNIEQNDIPIYQLGIIELGKYIFFS